MAALVIVEIVVFDGEEERVVRSLQDMAGVLSVKRLDQDDDNGFPYPEGTPEHAAAYGEPDDEAREAQAAYDDEWIGRRA